MRKALIALLAGIIAGICLFPLIIKAVQYSPIRLTDNTGNYVGSGANPIYITAAATSTPSVPALVSQNIADNGPTVDVPMSPTAGHRLIAIGQETNPTVNNDITITDSSGSNTWVKLIACYTATPNDIESDIWSVANAVAGTYNVHQAGGHGNTQTLHVSEWSGTGALDLVGNCSTDIVIANPMYGGTITTVNNNDLIIGATGSFQLVTLGAPTCGPTACTGVPNTWTALTKFDVNYNAMQPAYIVSTTPGLWQEQVNATVGNGAGVGELVAFKPGP